MSTKLIQCTILTTKASSVSVGITYVLIINTGDEVTDITDGSLGPWLQPVCLLWEIIRLSPIYLKGLILNPTWCNLSLD